MASSKSPPSGACPICGKASEERYRPFCSRRCADVDLSRWLSGAYAIPGEFDPEDDPETVAGEPEGQEPAGPKKH